MPDDVAAPDAPKRIKLRAQDWASAAIISILFVILLMTAIAQQEVVTRLKDAKLNVSYTSALALAREADAGERQLDKLIEDERRQAAEVPKKQSAMRLAERNAEAAWQSFVPLVKRFAGTKLCPVSIPADDDLRARIATLRELDGCEGEPDLSRSAARRLQAAQVEARTVRGEILKLGDAANDLTQHMDFLNSTREQIKTARALTDDQRIAQAGFSDTGILTQHWWLLGGLLVPFPPAMLQILLTFISGLFGSLLVTVILVVYPRNELDGGLATQTGARTLLGGMIALCVYIVILGSTAVLGSNSGLAAAGTNYMALCAVAILAGMFSDRVAGWLSEKADSFFKGSGAKAEKPAAEQGRARPQA